MLWNSWIQVSLPMFWNKSVERISLNECISLAFIQAQRNQTHTAKMMPLPTDCLDVIFKQDLVIL
jgi:hypothetical protein